VIRPTKIHLVPREGRLIYLLRSPEDLQFMFLSAVVYSLVVTGFLHWLEVEQGWKFPYSGSLMMIPVWLSPMWFRASFEVRAVGLWMGKVFVPAEGLRELEYHEGKNRGLYAGELCIGPNLERDDALRLKVEIEKVIGVRREN
jgi:hypothetical protein